MRQKQRKKGLNSHSPKVLETSTTWHIFTAYHDNILFDNGDCNRFGNLNAWITNKSFISPQGFAPLTSDLPYGRPKDGFPASKYNFLVVT